MTDADRFDAVIAQARAAAIDGERHRRWAPDLVETAKRDGLFCMVLPQRFGGLGCEPATVVDVLERLAHADGAAGWCGFIGNATSFFGWLDPTVVAATLIGAPHVAAASVWAPHGQAVPAGRSRYRIDGRWSFVSGCLHSEYLQVGVLVHGDDGMHVRTDGSPDWRFAFLPTAAVEIVDTWDTLGLRGTGSNDVIAVGALVDQELLAMPLLDEPVCDDTIFQLGFWCLAPLFMAPFPLGVARRALDELERSLAEQAPNGRPLPRLDPQVQHELGRARGALLAARALLDDAVGHAWTAVREGTPAGVEHQDRMTLALHHAMDIALDCADVAYRFAGTAVVRSGDAIQRCFRDLHTARKHLVFGLNGYRGVARHTLGVT